MGNKMTNKIKCELCSITIPAGNNLISEETISMITGNKKIIYFCSEKHFNKSKTLLFDLF